MLVGMPFFLWHRMIRYKKKNKRLYILRKTGFVLRYELATANNSEAVLIKEGGQSVERKKQSALQRLFEYAGNFRYLSIASWILSAVSALIALVPFYYIWRIVQEVLRVAPDYSNAAGLSRYGWQALRDAQCEDIIEKLPEGVDTVIGSSGIYVSGGEAQRIAIARAMLKDAPIILLDEATASLDVDNETMIQEALSRLIQNKTVLIIAHRLRTVADADKIVVLKDGVVAETGTPEQLMKQQGIYQHMTQVQNEAAAWKW